MASIEVDIFLFRSTILFCQISSYLLYFYYNSILLAIRPMNCLFLQTTSGYLGRMMRRLIAPLATCSRHSTPQLRWRTI